VTFKKPIVSLPSSGSVRAEKSRDKKGHTFVILMQILL